MKGKITIVVGGQYGSEAKGTFCGYLCEKEDIEATVRTGSINAGHTVPYKGKFYKNQQIPVGWVNPGTKLIIGAGAYIEEETLDREIKMIEEATGESLKHRLFIDRRCGVHENRHKEAEKGMHERFGSTGEGCSEAIMEKMRRKSDYTPFARTDYAGKNNDKHFKIVDTTMLLDNIYNFGGHILLEGTQGTLLDMQFGDYPFVTSRQTTAALWLAEAGLSPTMNIEIAMVCRTYPIRVAGNSGPMGEEISWEQLARVINKKREARGLPFLVDPFDLIEYENKLAGIAVDWDFPNANPSTWSDEEKSKHSARLVEFHKQAFSQLDEGTRERLFKFFETTTVTKKLRRIANFSIENLEYAVRLNKPTYLVMNFLNYRFPTLYDYSIQESPERGDIIEWLNLIGEETGVPIKYLNYKADSIEVTSEVL